MTAISRFQSDRYYELPDQQRQALFSQYGSNEAAIKAMDEYVHSNETAATNTTITTEFAGMAVASGGVQLGDSLSKEPERWTDAYAFRFGSGDEAAKAFVDYYSNKGFTADQIAQVFTRDSSQELPANNPNIDVAQIYHRPWSKTDELTDNSVEVKILTQLGYKVTNVSKSTSSTAVPPAQAAARTPLTGTGKGDDTTYNYTGGNVEINDLAGKDILAIDPSILSKAAFEGLADGQGSYTAKPEGSNDYLIDFGGGNSILIKNTTDATKQPPYGVGVIEELSLGGTNYPFTDFVQKAKV